MFNLYEVGKVEESFIGHAQGATFDLSDAGGIIKVFFNHPTQYEVDQFAQGKHFEIRFTELYGVIMVTFKIGDLNWMDAPYSPHLGEGITKFELPGENKGLSLMLMLINSTNGVVKSLRLLGLSEQFIKSLYGVAMEQKMANFNKDVYSGNLQRIYSSYTTKQLVSMSKNYCKFND